MANSIATYLINDGYAPPIPKPSSQQYVPYQNYDLCCVDNWFETTNTDSSITKSAVNKQLAFLAVQAYDIVPIACDFMAIVEVYK